MGKQFFSVRVLEPWHRLPGELAKSLFLEILKAHLTVVLGHRLWLALLEDQVSLPTWDSVGEKDQRAGVTLSPQAGSLSPFLHWRAVRAAL